MNKKIYIILVNYNSYQDTIECIESLKQINFDSYKIIIVDNASTDESVNKLINYADDRLVLLRSNKNLGFSGGNNIGIKYALDDGADYVLLLNNDTIVEPDFLQNMVETAENDKEIGIVGCKIKYNGDRNLLWFAGGQVNWFKFLGEHFGKRELDDGKYDKLIEVSFVTGCCMLIKREVIEKVGMLPDEYFMYFEDVDFCVRVQEAGFKIIYEPKAVIYHKIGISSGGEESPFSIKWSTRNRIYFMHKFKYRVSRPQFLISNIFFYTTRLVRVIQYYLKGDKKRAIAIIEGIKEGRNMIIKGRLPVLQQHVKRQNSN
jgi:hypothetical protein